MGKRKRKNKTTKTFVILRHYVSEISEENLTDIDLKLAPEIGLGEKTIQSISRGDRDFKWGEAKKVAKYFETLCKDKDTVNIEVLRKLMYDFLLNYGTLDADAEVNEKIVTDFLITLLGCPVDNMDTASKIKAEAICYNNLPENSYNGDIIRKNIVKTIDRTLKEKRIAFLSGFTGNGKSFIASIFVKTLYDCLEDGAKYAIWVDCRKGGAMQFNDFLTRILLAFQIENVGNLSIIDKEDSAKRHLRENRIMLVIDGFENIRTLKDKHAILNFISSTMHRNSIFIITCKERLSYYRDIIESPNRFGEIKINCFTMEEWKILLNIYSSFRNDIAEAVDSTPEIETYVFNLCKGNPYLMTHVLASVSEKILKGISFNKIKEDYELLEIDKKSYNTVLDKSIRELSDNCKNLLVTLSFFVSPVPLSVLVMVSGLEGVDEDGNLIEGSDIDVAISDCHNLYLIDRYVPNSGNRIKFFLPDMLRTIMNSVLKEKHNHYLDIVNRWVAYYVEYSKKIGFCFDDFDRLTLLDNDVNSREIDNIIYLLNYCESEQRWKDFYTISENTKYFFYTRGISGEGKNSIHYRRSLAAHNLKDYVAEFNSLVYHCNVACKSKSWKDIAECFGRIEELCKMVDNIPHRNLLKYQYIKALYAFFHKNIEDALIFFADYKEKIETILSKCKSDKIIDKMILHDYIASLRWYSECLYLSINDEHDHKVSNATIEQAFTMLNKAIKLADGLNFERAIVHSKLIQVKFYLNIMQNIDNAGKLLKELEKYKSTIKNDAMYNHEYQTLIEQYNSRGG